MALSTTDFNEQFSGGGEIGKITEEIFLSYGREGIVHKNGIEFLFNIGDIIVADSIIKFIDQPDTIVYNSAEELNQVVKTESFHLSSNTEFFFTNFYYVLNGELADSALTENDLVNFRAELVNSQTGTVVGTFDNITYTKQQLEKYDNISYQVDCSSISPGYYYLRLVTYAEGEVDYFLGNVQNIGESIDKKNYLVINFNGLTNPESYDLAQNYPNPFNPTTIIKYQIPEDGIVSLKIYDILGKEIKTLVNEHKPTGRYEINFDASNLASGVYIYRIQINDFVSSKKMMLVK